MPLPRRALFVTIPIKKSFSTFFRHVQYVRMTSHHVNRHTHGRTHTETYETDFITSTADAGGKNLKERKNTISLPV